MRNPLNTSQGKGDTPRRDTKKYRKGWDEIDWSEKPKVHPDWLKPIQYKREFLVGLKKGKKKTIKFKSLIEGLRRKK